MREGGGELCVKENFLRIGITFHGEEYGEILALERIECVFE